MENDSLKPAIAVAVALVFTAIWLRRRFGSFGDIWAAAMAKYPSLRPGDILKVLFVATGALWLAVWLFTSPEQRAEMKRYFSETSPWATYLTPTKTPDAPR